MSLQNLSPTPALLTLANRQISSEAAKNSRRDQVHHQNEMKNILPINNSGEQQASKSSCRTIYKKSPQSIFQSPRIE